MDNAVRHAVTTELTLCGMQGLSTSQQVSWNHFYRIALSTAKMLDSTRPQNVAKQCQSNSNHPGKGSGNPSQQGNRLVLVKTMEEMPPVTPPLLIQHTQVLIWL
jgi:hypothetical protein